MPNTFFGLTIGASGLTAGNAGINTVAHNVANIKTKGYTKQTVNQVAGYAIKVYKPYGAVGTGVEVKDIIQSRDEYYDARYRANSSLQGQYESLDLYSHLVQNYLDEFSLDGFITEYNNLYKTIDALTSEPSSDVKRGQFIGYMTSMCEYFNTLHTNLQNTQNDINTEIKASVSTINRIADSIASLNKQINTIEATGGFANELRDSRNLMLDELSTYVNITTLEVPQANGITDFTVFLGDAKLVDKYTFNQLICVARETAGKRNASDAEGLYDLKWSDTQSTFDPYNSTIKGSLRGLFDIRDGCNNGFEKLVPDGNGGRELVTVSDAYKNTSYKGIPYYQSKLNEFMKVFADNFNEILKKGQLADGTANTEDLLVSKYGDDYISAGNICVNEKIVKDRSKLPLSYDVSKGSQNADLYKDLYLLKDKRTISSGTFWDYLTSIVSEIGVDTSRTETFSKNYKNVVATIDNQRQSVSGVDQDEEGIDLVKYLNAYNLAAKVLSTMNEIYNKLINETGL